MKDNLDDNLSKSDQIPNDHYKFNNKKYYLTNLTSSRLTTAPELNMSCLIDSNKRTINGQDEFSKRFSQVSSVSSTTITTKTATTTSTLRKKPEPPNWLGEFAQEFYQENQKFMDSLNAIYCSINANLNNTSANNVFINSDHSRDVPSLLASSNSSYPESLRRLSCPSVLSVNSKLISQCYDSRVLRKSSVDNWNALKSNCTTMIDDWRIDNDIDYATEKKKISQVASSMSMEDDDIGNSSKHLNPNANDFSPNLNKKYHHSVSENYVVMLKKEQDQSSNDACSLMTRKKDASKNVKKINDLDLDGTINKSDKGACFIFDESYFDNKEESSKLVQKFDEQQLMEQLAIPFTDIDQPELNESSDGSMDNAVNCLTGQPVYFFQTTFTTNVRSFLFS